MKRFLQSFRQGVVLAGNGMLAGERKRSSTFCMVDVEMTEPAEGLCVDVERLLSYGKAGIKVPPGVFLKSNNGAIF